MHIVAPNIPNIPNYIWSFTVVVFKMMIINTDIKRYQNSIAKWNIYDLPYFYPRP